MTAFTAMAVVATASAKQKKECDCAKPVFALLLSFISNDFVCKTKQMNYLARIKKRSNNMNRFHQ